MSEHIAGLPQRPLEALPHPPPSRARVGYLPLDRVRMEEVLALAEERVRRGEGACVLLAGVPQAVAAESHPRLREALAGADLCLAGAPELVWAAQQVGRPLPEQRSGVEWLLPLLQRARERDWRPFLIGSGPGSAERAAEALRREHRAQVVGVATPMVPAEPRGYMVESLVRRLEEARPHLVLTCMDTPRQELLCRQLAARLRRVVVGAGEALHALAEPESARAPREACGNAWGWVRWLLAEPLPHLRRDLSFLMLMRRTARVRQHAHPGSSGPGRHWVL
jgi:N-acetylglucosaminyldiphosphoundecaprenol N-acetyl-beta-D-mannosaminyltransferase